jgi:hypothetical protein
LLVGKPETCRGTVTELTEDKQCIKLVSLHAYIGGPGSSVGIATAYGLDGPGIE